MAILKYKDENGDWQEIAMGGDSTEVIDNLESDSTTAALSANQGKVLKEMIGQTGNGVKMYQVYLDPANDEEKAVNVEAYNAIRDAEDALYYFEVVDDASNVVRYEIESPVFMSDMAVVIAMRRNVAIYNATATGLDMQTWSRIIMSDGSTSEAGVDYQFQIPSTEAVEEMIPEVDTTMSDTSENAVQNKVIKAYVDESISTAITTTLNTAV